MSQVARQQLLAYLERLEQRYVGLEERAVGEAADVQSDPKAYQQLSKELSDLRWVVNSYRTLKRLEQEATGADALLQTHADSEMQELAREEAVSLRRQQDDLLLQLERYWIEQHEEPDRPIIVEIRAGTGGLEASLFASDLYRMYSKYAAKLQIPVEPMSGSPSEAGGFKEISFALRGRGAWKHFKYESGVHRVQRVPATEAQGRIHTSTVTVAVMIEPEEVELPSISNKDLQIDVYRASGPGGQGVNTTDSAVRIRHIPTGVVVTCQDERSQMRNKEKAMRVLRARLLDEMQRSQHESIASDRRKQVGSGDRSEKIRTYNFPDRRITDHRIGFTMHQLDAAMEGELQPLIDALTTADRAKRLEDSVDSAGAD